MRICDLTFAYTSSSGGIRTYLDQKRAHLLANTDHEHVLIIPDEQSSIVREGRSLTLRIASPYIPGCEPYRFFCRPKLLLDALREASPDVIELGSFFLEPWMAFRVRDELRELGRRCAVVGYFHTDLAGAYVGEPIRRMLGTQLASWSDQIASLGLKIGHVAEAGASSYFGSIFKRCDRMFAASDAQSKRLAAYGVDDARVAPLGVDLQRFSPSRRSAEVRARYGADDDTCLLVYAGRLDREKRVGVLVDAFRQTQLPKAVLLLLGEGPLRAELEAQASAITGLQVLPYERYPDALAGLLASADVYVTAGPHETFGLSVIEAQASGLPVVGVAAGALIERVPIGIGLLGPVDDPAAMAHNIEQSFLHARAWGTAARQHVEASRLGWDATFENLLNSYAELRDGAGDSKGDQVVAELRAVDASAPAAE